jgi:hypothetical protein
VAGGKIIASVKRFSCLSFLCFAIIVSVLAPGASVARKLLVSVWYVLTNEAPDRFAEPELVARKLLQYAYVLGKANRPASQSPGQFVRDHLDRLGLGADLTTIPWGAKKPRPLPPSALLQNSK